MRKIRVLIVDDSVVIRRILSNVLASDPGIEVAGVAQDGRIALGKIAALNPDLVILDVEMPNMDGLAALAEIRARWPRMPVLMYSSLTHRGAAATLDALALGANDYLTKPSGAEGPEEAVESVRAQLIPRIKAFCGGPSPRATEPLPASLAIPRAPVPPAPHLASQATPARRPTATLRLVAMGTSTGGPNALMEILPAFPADFPLPIVIVQHMPPIFTRMLAERLATRCAIGVTEGVHDEPLRPGHAYIAPGDRHMTVSVVDGAAVLRLNDDARENSCRPAVDVLFRSAAAAYPGGTLGIMLTGLGCDGLKGSEAIVESGGVVFAQDEPTSVVWGMPGSVVKAGLADRVLPLDLIGGSIVSRALAAREQTVGGLAS
jgi:two-component system chemotaxis response regulator CheB